MTEKSQWKAYAALAVVCVLWGTTYLALGIGVKSFPPFLFSGIRQFVAGLILFVALKLVGKLHISKTNFWHQSVPGVLMITLGNGVIGWAEKFIPSGLAALIVSILPVFVVLIGWAIGTTKKRPNFSIWMGLLFGSIGIVLIFKDNLKDLINPSYLLGMLVTFAACLSWAFGSIYAKSRPSSDSILTNAAIQMFSGGIVLLVMSLCFDNYQELSTVTSDSIWALLYLIVFGSLITYSCFVYALAKLPVGVASLYAYVNPFIALVLGYFILSEPLTWLTFLALGAALTGVYFINRGYQQKS